VSRVTGLSAFLDLPAASFDVTVAFWSAVTGYGLSSPRGERSEFVTLVPPGGDGYLKVQRLADGPPRIHLDVHAPDHVFAVRASPGGFPWCSVSHPVALHPRAATWPDGNRSRVDQVCLDIPRDVYDRECAYWSELTGWPLEDTSAYDEFRRLRVPPGQPLKVLLQRLDEPTGPVRAHLDLGTDDRPAEVARHRALGAEWVGEGRGWTVLRDPSGWVYCVTDHRLD
jgi:Glyoxalase-like domain